MDAEIKISKVHTKFCTLFALDVRKCRTTCCLSHYCIPDILRKNWIFWLFKLSKAASYRLSSHAFLWWDPSIHPPTYPHPLSQSLVFVFAIIGIICMKQSNVKRIWTFFAYFAHGKRTEEPAVAATATVAMIACTHAGAGVKNLKPWVPTVPWMGMVVGVANNPY